MKATGIVRRVDDLGRIVIPKEIRRTLKIREGDPLPIHTDGQKFREIFESIEKRYGDQKHGRLFPFVVPEICSLALARQISTTAQSFFLAASAPGGARKRSPSVLKTRTPARFLNGPLRSRRSNQRI